MIKKEDILKKLDYSVSARKMKDIYNSLSSEERIKFKNTISEFRNTLFIKLQKYKKQPNVKRTINKKLQYLNELEGVLKGKATEAEVKTITAKVRAIAIKLKIPFSKESTTSIRGFHTYTSGIKISSEPYFRPYEYTQVEYIFGGHGLISEKLREKRNKILSLITSESRKLGYKVTKQDNNLKIEM